MKKIFFLTYPFNEKNSGDYDYCSVMVDAINKSNTSTIAQYITAEVLEIALLDKIIGAKNKGGSSFKDSMNEYFKNHQRSENASKIIEFIAKDIAPQKVLNIQMRPPESGFIFTPKEIEEIKALGIKVCITCHEYKLNYTRTWLQEIMHPYFAVADKVFFFNEKDLSNANKYRSGKDKATSFKVSGVAIGSLIESIGINEDIEQGTYDLKAKACSIRVPATIPLASSEPFSSRPPNIITFGIIRANKGFEEALDFIKASSVDEDLSKSRLIIAGKCDSYKILAEILKAQYQITLDEYLLKEIEDGSKIDFISMIRDFKERKNKVIQEAIPKHAPCQKKLAEYGFEQSLIQYKSNAFVTIEREEKISKLQEFISLLAASIPEILPIDIFLDVSMNSLAKLFNKAKYAIKFDEKGWANNASSLINSLYFGCVLYTSWGMCTDKEVTDGEYKGAIVLPKGKYALKEGKHLSKTEEVKGKKKCYKTSGKKVNVEKNFFVSAQSLIDDIKLREKKDSGAVSDREEWAGSSSPLLSNISNTKTLEKAKLLLASFEVNKIALSMIDVFEQFFPNSTSIYNELLVQLGDIYNNHGEQL